MCTYASACNIVWPALSEAELTPTAALKVHAGVCACMRACMLSCSCSVSRAFAVQTATHCVDTTTASLSLPLHAHLIATSYRLASIFHECRRRGVWIKSDSRSCVRLSTCGAFIIRIQVASVHVFKRQGSGGRCAHIFFSLSVKLSQVSTWTSHQPTFAHIHARSYAHTHKHARMPECKKICIYTHRRAHRLTMYKNTKKRSMPTNTSMKALSSYLLQAHAARRPCLTCMARKRARAKHTSKARSSSFSRFLRMR